MAKMKIGTKSPKPGIGAGPLEKLQSRPRVDILLPSKERFTKTNAGAISGVVRDLIEASQTPDCFNVVGMAVDAPFSGIKFTGLKPIRKWLYGSNIGLARAYLRRLDGAFDQTLNETFDETLNESGPPALIEVHSRCHVAAYIKAKRPDLKVALYLHNDPRDMKGAQTTQQRLALLQQMSAIICVSDYIVRCFLDGLTVDSALTKKVQSARNGAARWLTSPPVKKPMILIAGRMVPEKGILECATAIATVLADRPDWRVVVAGAKRFETAAPGSYEAEIGRALAPLGERAQMTGFVPIETIRALQADAAISACPSIWNDPMPKAVIESLAAGCALLTTRRGGIPEVAEGRAHIVDNPSIEEFVAALEKLVNDDKYRIHLQHLAWTDFPFTAEKMASDADSIRLAAITSET